MIKIGIKFEIDANEMYEIFTSEMFDIHSFGMHGINKQNDWN